MTKNATIALWGGVIVIVLMGIFPPWVKVQSWINSPPTTGHNVINHEIEYGFFFSPPKTDHAGHSVVSFVDLSRLVVQWVVVASLTLAIVFTLNRRRAEPGRDNGVGSPVS